MCLIGFSIILCFFGFVFDAVLIHLQFFCVFDLVFNHFRFLFVVDVILFHFIGARRLH